jgi:hypothetical protein
LTVVIYSASISVEVGMVGAVLSSITTYVGTEKLVTTGMTIWAAFGPLVGVLVGAYIANRNQRRQWVGNCKKEEYRELISVLTKARTTYLQVHHFPPDVEQHAVQVLADETFRIAEMTGDRIFIASVVKRLNVLERWYAATTLFEAGGEANAFTGSVATLLDEIRDAAIKDIGA